MASTTSTTLLPPLPKFNGTCVPIQYPCFPGTRYIDPCDCKYYYLCRTTGSIVRLACVKGTAFDHTGSNSICQRMSNVVGAGKCDHSTPWQRCQDNYGSSADLQKLQSWCVTSGYLTPPPPRDRGDDGPNAGAIAAIVILLLLLVIVIVLIVIYVRKKGNPLKKVKDTSCWQNLVWCWKEVVCCGSDGGNYYYEDDDDDGGDGVDGGGSGGSGGGGGGDEERAQGGGHNNNNNKNNNSSFRRGSDRGGGCGGGSRSDVPNSHRSGSWPTFPSNADLPPQSGRRSSRQEKEKGIEKEDGTYHDFGETKMERRMSARRSQVAIAEDPDLEAAAAAVYNNPAFDPHFADHDDDPPPDTEHNPAPPAYSSRARELNKMDHDLIEASFAEDPIPMGQGRMTARSSRSSRSHSLPAFHLGSDSEDSESSYVA